MTNYSQIDSMNKNMMDNQKSRIIFILLLAGVLLLHMVIMQQRKELGIIPGVSNYYDTPKKVFESVFREVGRTIADMLWIRVDTYFHAALTKEEHELIHPGHHEHKVGEETGIKAGASTQFLPLIRLVTDFDPHFIDAYRTGSWWLWNRLNEVEPAIDFLKEGIRNNPDNYELRYDLAWLYFIKLEKYDLAGVELEKAYQIVKSQPQKYDQKDLALVMELQAFTCEKLNQNSEAIRIWSILKAMNVPPYSEAATRHLHDLNPDTQVE